MLVKDNDGVVKFVDLQSIKNEYVMIMAYAKDRKALYRHLKNWFKFINKIKKECLPYHNKNNKAIKPILTRIPQDISSIQKALNLGGACNSADLFCHLCACCSYGGNYQLMRWREGHHLYKIHCLNKPNPPKK